MTAVVPPGRFVYSSLVLFSSGVLSAAAGVGGGGINVPILSAIFGYSFKRSRTFSSCFLLGSYFSQIIVNFPRSHPHKSTRPLVYIELILILLPAQLGGSNIGSILAEILPDPVLFVIALCVLSFASAFAYWKGRKYYAKENEALSKLNRTDSSSSTSFEYACSSFGDPSNVQLSDNFTLPDKSEQGQPTGLQTKLVAINPQTADPIAYPWFTILCILLMWMVYVALLVTMNSFHNCSIGNTVTLIAIYPWLIIAIFYGVFIIRANQASDPAQVLVGDVSFNYFDIKPPALVFLVGIICSLLGIGGSELIGPLLLSMGVLPQVSAATTSFLSFFTTLAILVDDAAKGTIDYNVGGILLPIGFCAGFVGRNAGVWFADVYKRPSYLIFALMLVLILSLIFYIARLSAGVDPLEVSNFCKDS